MVNCCCYRSPLFFGGIKEGFEASLVGLGTALNYKMGDGVTGSWENTDTLKEHVKKNKDIRDINYNKVDENADLYANLEHNVTGPIPLPDDELVFFDKNTFSPTVVLQTIQAQMDVYVPHPNK